MDSNRQQKINRLIQKELSELFLLETKKMQGVLISVTNVRVSPDLSVAHAYLSIFPSDKGEELVKALKKLFINAKSRDWPQKAVVFTESTRTQEYLAGLLDNAGISYTQFNGANNSIRARKAGFDLYCYSKAKTYHQGIKKTFVHPWVEWLGITSPERAFRVARNKMIFMRKHSPFPQNLFFLS